MNSQLSLEAWVNADWSAWFQPPAKLSDASPKFDGSFAKFAVDGGGVLGVLPDP
jgi:hypothetical protein